MTLAAILGMTGAWAQDTEQEETLTLTPTANAYEWTLTMPASNVELEVEYYTIDELRQLLAEAITDVETLFTSIKDNHPTIASVLEKAIDAAKAVKDNPSATLEQIDAAKTAIATAKATAEANALAAAKEKLQNAIAIVQDFHDLFETADPDFAQALQNAIAVAKIVVDNKDSSRRVLEATVTALKSAIMEKAKEKLGEKINTVQEYYDLIKNVNTALADNMLSLVNSNTDIKNNPDATLAQIGGGIVILDLAILAAEIEISLKRVNITIPAKSYVTRIDADKRKIDDMYTIGVSLYSVEDVTGTEVKLTDELTIVAAETPYLIYNSTDEEVTASLITSTEDADDVTAYEGFKGTLEAASIAASTDAQNNYALNGSEFVWVKDALDINANKCWLEVPATGAAASGARTLKIGFADATAISSPVLNGTAAQEWYTIDGRKLSAVPTTKGIYVTNGKKVVIK